MALSSQDVSHVALLARLALPQEQLDSLKTELNSILGHIDQISSLDLDGVEPTTHSVPLTNATRADVPHQCLDRETTLLNAPDQQNGAFLIPRIIGPGGGA